MVVSLSKNKTWAKKGIYTIGYLILKKTHSNFFITLTDKNKKVVSCKSAGSVVLTNKKKGKIAPQVMENLALAFSNIFKLYNLNAVKLFLKLRPTSHLFILIKHLTLLDIKIISFQDIKRLPHNGMRGRKIRRI